MLTRARYLSLCDCSLPGIRRVITVPNPAPGAEWSIVIPGGEQWRVLMMRHVLTTSAFVTNRLPAVDFTVHGSVVFESASTVAITAGITFKQALFPGATFAMTSNSSSKNNAPLPSAYLPSGTVIGTSTANLDVGDQWSAIALFVERLYVTDQDLGDILADWEQSIVFGRPNQSREP